MSRILPAAIILLLVPVFTGCGESPPPDPKNAQSCPKDYFWNGKECEKQRTILLDEGKNPPPPPPPAPTSS